MAIEQLQVAVGICDACKTRRHGGPDGEPPEGITGTVLAPVPGHDGVREALDWFSCKSAPGHIGKAVRAVLDSGEAT